MKIKTRYTAYTLLELTIAMLITSICVALAFYALRTFHRIDSTLQQTKQKDYASMRFGQLFRQEAFQSETITYTGSQLLFKGKKREIIYEFTRSAVIRYQEGIVTDSLEGRIDDFLVRYIDDNPSSHVTDFSFIVYSIDRQLPLSIQKIYSANQLLTLQQDP